VGYQGVLCGTCSIGYHANGATCDLCIGATKYAIIIVAFIAAAALALFIWISKRFDTSKLVNGAKVAGSLVLFFSVVLMISTSTIAVP
jgi:hypothetical protein